MWARNLKKFNPVYAGVKRNLFSAGKGLSKKKRMLYSRFFGKCFRLHVNVPCNLQCRRQTFSDGAGLWPFLVSQNTNALYSPLLVAACMVTVCRHLQNKQLYCAVGDGFACLPESVATSILSVLRNAKWRNGNVRNEL